MIGYLILTAITAFMVGIVFTKLVEKKPKVFGYLNVFNSTEDGEDPYLFLDLDIPPNQISKEKYVTFIVSLK